MYVYTKTAAKDYFLMWFKGYTLLFRLRVHLKQDSCLCIFLISILGLSIINMKDFDYLFKTYGSDPYFTSACSQLIQYLRVVEFIFTF